MTPRRRPLFPLLIGGGLMILLCLGLGVWQLDRLAWKADLIARMAERLDGPPVTLAAAETDPDASRFRPIELTGRFNHDAEMQVGARTVDRVGGVDVMTPLVVTAGVDAGRTALVLRGWVPLDLRAPETRPDSRPEGDVTVRGWVRQPQPVYGLSTLLLPDDRPGERYWVRVDLASMADAAGLPRIPSVYVQAAPMPEPSGDGFSRRLPVGRAPDASLPNPHLSYAITWFGLAAVLTAMMALMSIRRSPGPTDHA